MPSDLTLAQILAKNQLQDTGAYIILARIALPNDGPVIRVAMNTEDVDWRDPVSESVETWIAFPVELDDMSESSKGEIPRTVLRVSNIGGIIQSYADQADGGNGSEVRLFVVYSEDLGNHKPLVEAVFTSTESQFSDQWFTLTLGAANVFSQRFPLNRVIKTFCRYKRFKGARCGYTGPETSCDRTLARCRALGNSVRFGGAPGASAGGDYV